jgi:DNA-binding CsgD family transcriptional regulator/tetratricopeptide (TPR) repeat protein
MKTSDEVSSLAGRVEESGLLAAAIRAAAEGEPRAVLVHGEAGIGKTRLVTAVCAGARSSGMSVLQGRCVRFAATTAPYLPIVSAFEGYLRDTTDRGRATQPVREVLATLTGSGPSPPTGRLIRVVDDALGRVVEHGPAVLMVDDIQWADASTLDVLTYALAVAPRRALVMLLTYRDELVPGHRLHGWLGDVRRLPEVSELALARLSREETEEQAALLFGKRPSMRLVDEVRSRSHGNPYLSELLLREVGPDAEEVPAAVPDALRDALLAGWHRLAPESRELTRVLAVSGRPVGAEHLAAAADLFGGCGDLATALDEGRHGGIVDVGSGGEVWFHHPLLCEVLYDTLLPGERRRGHLAFVRVLESASASDRSLSAHLAVHYERAGLPAEAFTRSLRAAQHAHLMQAFSEEAEQRRRAAELWPRTPVALRRRAGSEAELWNDAAQAASRVGWDEEAYADSSRAKALMAPEADPLGAARTLRLWRAHSLGSGMPEDRLVADREAVRLSGRYPNSEEHARCLAQLADAATFAALPQVARTYAAQAVEAAHRSGSTLALCFALASRSAAHLGDPQALVDADEAQRLAHECGDPEAIGQACVYRANALEVLHRFPEKAEAYERGYRSSVEHGYGRQQQRLATYAASAMLDVGRYDEARRLLREALARPAPGDQGLLARLTGVALESRTGDLAAATRHLERAHEIAPDVARLLTISPAGILACYHLTAGQPVRALDIIKQHFSRRDPDPETSDWHVLWAAIAVGDAVALGDDLHGSTVPEVRETLKGLLAERDVAGGEMFAAADPVAQAHRAVLRAELARAFGNDEEIARWDELAEIEDCYGEAWVMTNAMLHWAQSLTALRADRNEISVPLRRAHRRASELGADGLRRRAEDLARRLRIPLGGVAEAAAPNRPRDLAGLTPREAEILEHLVAGQTYAEIAAALFISKKTVSVHVSHVLQKTGTSSRAQATAWAWQHDVTPETRR